MAHFAEIDTNNVVLRVVVVPDEHEARGEAFLRYDLGLGGRWVQTSYTGAIHARFAGIGHTYDATHDAFLPPKPAPSWVLDAPTLAWVAPVPPPAPVAGQSVAWNEPAQKWVPVGTVEVHGKSFAADPVAEMPLSDPIL